MKVSPKYIIQLSHNVITLHRKKEILLKVQVKRTREFLRAQVKRDKENCKPGSKDRGDILYVY